MTANVRQRVRCEPVLARQTLEVTAQMRPLVKPAPYSQVRVIALREHPSVPAGNDAELHPRRRLVRVGIEAAPRNVSLERNPTHDPVAEACDAGNEPVCSVSPDDVRGLHPRSSDQRGSALVVELEVIDANAVPEVRSSGGCLLREVKIEPTALRHLNQRPPARPRKTAPIASPKHEAVYHVLDHRIDVARRMTKSTTGEAPAARLVAWEASLVDEEHAGAGAREMDRRRRPSGACADNDDVKSLHPHDRRVSRRPRLQWRAPRRGSRVAKGGGL